MNISNEYSFLNLLISNNYLHAKFLNTISFLEYTGARKILKGQKEENIDLNLLNHMNDEIRHAQMFKKYAYKVYPSKKWKYNIEDVFCYDLARSFIGRLDRFCEKLVKKSSCYPIVSYVIEKRALSFYNDYFKILKGNNINIPLGALLGEEERHLDEMTKYMKDLIQPDELVKVINFEKKIFNDFCYSLSLEILSNEESRP